MSRQTRSQQSCLSNRSLNSYSNPNLQNLQRIAQKTLDKKNKPKTAQQSPQKQQIVELPIATEEDQGIICPLDDPEFPIVSDLEHYIGQCYCYLCECDQHICPLILRRLLALNRGFFKSQYQHNYRRYNSVQRLPPKKDVPTAGSFVKYYDLQTTNRQDFIKHNQSPEKIRQQTPKAQQKFIARSLYQTDFWNWKASTCIEKAPQHRIRSEDIEYKPQSLYKQDFKDTSPQKQSSIMKFYTTSFKQGPIHNFYDGDLVSTARKSYQKVGTIYQAWNSKAKGDYLPTIAPQYRSTYQQSFKESKSKFGHLRRNPSFS